MKVDITKGVLALFLKYLIIPTSELIIFVDKKLLQSFKTLSLDADSNEIIINGNVKLST